MKFNSFCAALVVGFIMFSQSVQAPVEGSFYFMRHPQFGTSLVYMGSFLSELNGVSIICENPETREIQNIVQDAYAANGSRFTIGPMEEWIWRPGGILTVQANGYEDYKISIPGLSSSEWNSFMMQVAQNTQQMLKAQRQQQEEMARAQKLRQQMMNQMQLQEMMRMYQGGGYMGDYPSTYGGGSSYSSPKVSFERKCTIHNETYDMRFGRCPVCSAPNL